MRRKWKIRGRLQSLPGKLALFFKFALFAIRKGRRPVVFVRYGAMGDVICSLPAVRAYLQSHPGEEVVYLTLAPFREILTRSQLPFSIIVMDQHVDLPPYLARFVTTRYSTLHYGDELAEPAQPPAHIIDDFAANLGQSLEDRSVSLIVNAASVTTLRERLLAGADAALIVIHSGPSWKVREWPSERWSALAAHLNATRKVKLVQIVSNRNVTVQAPVTERIAGTEAFECDDDISTLIDVIAAADLLIAIDSGPLHIAAAVDTPCLSLFGPTDPALRLWNLTRSAAVVHPVPCSFCHHRQPRLHWKTGCPYEIRCMRDLPVEAVLDAALRLLDRQATD